MFVHQIRERIFTVVEEGQQLEFPNKVTIEIAFEPKVPFGGVAGSSRNVVTDRGLLANFNFTGGFATIRHSEPLFDRISGSIEVADTEIQIDGNIARVKSHCSSLQDLQNLISALYYVFPAILNVSFPDALIPDYVKGVVGNVAFKWDYEPSQIVLGTVVTSKENQEQLVLEAWRKIASMSEDSNRRLIAGLHYFHVACRLLQAGHNRFEFLAEALLNYTKCLQALCGDKRDEVREKLQGLGIYTKEEIEMRFIRAMILRDEFDVAHIQLTVPNPRLVKVLHLYTDQAEYFFRDLLKCIVRAIKEGRYELPPTSSFTLSSKKRNILRRMLEELNQMSTDSRCKS